MPLISINPTNSETLAEYPELSSRETETAITHTRHAFEQWRKLSYFQRAEHFFKLADQLDADIEPLARLMALEMGKAIRDTRSEISKSANLCRYYAQHGEAFLADIPVKTEVKSYVHYQPLGVILGIMPWNFPVWQVMRYCVPVLMAGNTTLLKHARNVTGTAQFLAQLFIKAGFPEHVFQFLAIGAEKVASVIAHPDVAGVTLTGSLRAGSAVAEQAGKYLKPSVMELGGSDPLLILEDADIELAIEAGVRARLLGSGQVCISPKRFIIPTHLKHDIENAVVEKMQAAQVGDPLLEETDFGPLARADLKISLEAQIHDSVQKGARLLLGADSMEHCFYPATVLGDVKVGQKAYHEELFGPVISIICADSEAEAIAIANDTGFGLGASVFSRDLQRAEAIARNELEAGCCFVNASVHSDMRMPFGGIKSSGYGRELGIVGLKTFTNTKSVKVFASEKKS